MNIDNYLKIMLILQKQRANNPIIIMGETGCGKTFLLKYIAEVIYGDKAKFFSFTLYYGVKEDDYVNFVDDIIKIAEKNKTLDIWVFFDEFNTSELQSSICELMSDRTFSLSKIDKYRCKNILEFIRYLTSRPNKQIFQRKSEYFDQAHPQKHHLCVSVQSFQNEKNKSRKGRRCHQCPPEHEEPFVPPGVPDSPTNALWSLGLRVTCRGSRRKVYSGHAVFTKAEIKFSQLFRKLCDPVSKLYKSICREGAVECKSQGHQARDPYFQVLLLCPLVQKRCQKKDRIEEIKVFSRKTQIRSIRRILQKKRLRKFHVWGNRYPVF